MPVPHATKQERVPKLGTLLASTKACTGASSEDRAIGPRFRCCGVNVYDIVLVERIFDSISVDCCLIDPIISGGGLFGDVVYQNIEALLEAQMTMSLKIICL